MRFATLWRGRSSGSGLKCASHLLKITDVVEWMGYIINQTQTHIAAESRVRQSEGSLARFCVPDSGATARQLSRSFGGSLVLVLGWRRWFLTCCQVTELDHPSLDACRPRGGRDLFPIPPTLTSEGGKVPSCSIPSVCAWLLDLHSRNPRESETPLTHSLALRRELV